MATEGIGTLLFEKNAIPSCIDVEDAERGIADLLEQGMTCGHSALLWFGLDSGRSKEAVILRFFATTTLQYGFKEPVLRFRRKIYRILAKCQHILDKVLTFFDNNSILLSCPN